MAESELTIALIIISGDLSKRLKLNGSKRKKKEIGIFFQRKKKMSMLFLNLCERIYVEIWYKEGFVKSKAEATIYRRSKFSVFVFLQSVEN